MVRWMFYMKYGGSLQQVFAFLSLGAVGTTVFTFLNGTVMPDESFLEWWIGLIAADTILGGIRHLNAGDFSPKESFKGVLLKTTITLVGMYSLKAIPESLGDIPYVEDYFHLFTKVSVLTYLIGSILANSYIISGGKFPPKYFMGRWAQFEETGEIKQLINDDSE